MMHFIRNGKRILLPVFFTLALIAVTAAVAMASSEGHWHPSKWTSTDFYRILNFAVLAGALFIILKKPVASALSARIKGIKEQLAELEAKKSEAEKKLAEYDEKLAKLDKEAENIIAQYVQQGNEAKERILAEAKESATKLEDQAKRTIENEFKEARVRLQEEVLEKALAKAEEIVSKGITPEDQDRLVDEYLKKVVA